MNGNIGLGSSGNQSATLILDTNGVDLAEPWQSQGKSGFGNRTDIFGYFKADCFRTGKIS